MYEWIVDGLSSLFVPFSGEKSAAWPREHGNGVARAAGTDAQRLENSRPAKLFYSYIGHLSTDVIIRVVKKTVAGIAGLFQSRQHRKAEHEKQKAFTEVFYVFISLSSGAMLYKGSHDKGREMCRSLKLVPSCTTHGLSARPAEVEHPSRTHKSCLTVEEALRESDREHYRKLVEMASGKYSKTLCHLFFLINIMFCKFCSLFFSSSHSVQPLDVDLSAEVEARLNLKEKDTAAGSSLPSRSELITDTVRRSEEEIPRLTKEMQQEVSAALAQTDPNLVLCSAFKLRLTQRDLATLQEGSWLNDEVINFYMNLVMSRSEQEVGGRKVYSFSTFLFPKLHIGGHAAVRRWTKAVDLFLYDIILVPLHLGVHWSLAVVDFKSKSVQSYDSMGQRHDDICNMILLYLKEEFKVKKGKDLDTSKWTLSSLRPSEIPQQKNGSDCGVFVCKYADYISRGRNLTFRQNHMPYFRKAMIWEILNQKLLQ
uniref:SUMO specific peptidase 2 n=1 Tax=Cyprinus carpio TaxID=7962 RepID=A0A8C2BFP9_CYPCA